MGDARPSELSDALDEAGLCAKSTVIASCSPGTESVAVSPVRGDQRLQRRLRKLAEIEPVEDGVPELDEAHAQAVAAGRGTCST